MNFALLEDIWEEPIDKSLSHDEDENVELIKPSNPKKKHNIEKFIKEDNQISPNIKENFKDRITEIDYNIIVNKILGKVEERFTLSNNNSFNKTDIIIILIFGLVIILLIHGLINLGKMLGNTENKTLNRKIDYILRCNNMRGGRRYYKYYKY